MQKMCSVEAVVKNQEVKIIKFGGKSTAFSHSMPVFALALAKKPHVGHAPSFHGADQLFS
jgi:hypothetical protein